MKDKSKFPICYSILYIHICKIAMESGYALGLHGSMQRDCDVIAIPWIEDAIDAYELIERIRDSIGAFIVHNEESDESDYTQRNPEPKPHGRLAWSLHLGGGMYFDISVILKRDDS